MKIYWPIGLPRRRYADIPPTSSSWEGYGIRRGVHIIADTNILPSRRQLGNRAHTLQTTLALGPGTLAICTASEETMPEAEFHLCPGRAGVPPVDEVGGIGFL